MAPDIGEVVEAAVGPLVTWNDGQLLTMGTGDPFSFSYDTTDANAHFLKASYTTLAGNDVAIMALGIGIKSVDLTFFNGLTQPAYAVIDTDRDSFIKMGFASDDVPEITSNKDITFGAELVTLASAVGSSGFNLPSGTAPTSPVAGDVWYDGSNFIGFDGVANRALDVQSVSGGGFTDDGAVVRLTTAADQLHLGAATSFTGKFKVTGASILVGDLSIDGDLSFVGAQQIIATGTLDIEAVGELAINEGGNDVDFRVEGSTDESALFVEGSSNAVIIGGGASPALIQASSDLEVHGDEGSLGLVRSSDNTAASLLTFYKSRLGGVITTGDVLSQIIARGHDGTDNATIGAFIQFVSTGTIGSNQIPTNVEFFVSDGSGTLTKEWSILSGGVLEANGAQSITTGGNALLQLIGGTAGVRADNFLQLPEITTPSALTNFGAIYTMSTNELFFQDGAGFQHLLHGDAFSNIWFHSPSAATVTISSADTFVLIDSFAVVGKQDDIGNATGNASTNLITVVAAGAGDYNVTYQMSFSVVGGASRELLMVPGITLNTKLDITNVTDNAVSPIVITSTAHGLENGDMVTIVGVLVNTAANGDFGVANKTANTFEIVTLDGSTTSGNGDYNEGTPTGDVTIVYPGNIVTHREVSQSDLGVTSGMGSVKMNASDTIGLYVANLDDSSNMTTVAVSLNISRVGD